MLTQTIADRLSTQSQMSAELPALLSMIGEANMAARYSTLVRAASALHEAVEMCSAAPADVFSLPDPMGCDAETHTAMIAAHEAAMAARDLFFAREIKPLIDEAKRLAGRD